MGDATAGAKNGGIPQRGRHAGSAPKIDIGATAKEVDVEDPKTTSEHRPLVWNLYIRAPHFRPERCLDLAENFGEFNVWRWRRDKGFATGTRDTQYILAQ
eukprot:1358025-Amorphochlora_amoeboformis.AAC.2